MINKDDGSFAVVQERNACSSKNHVKVPFAAFSMFHRKSSTFGALSASMSFFWDLDGPKIDLESIQQVMEVNKLRTTLSGNFH
jgi:hypothetical protein